MSGFPDVSEDERRELVEALEAIKVQWDAYAAQAREDTRERQMREWAELMRATWRDWLRDAVRTRRAPGDVGVLVEALAYTKGLEAAVAMLEKLVESDGPHR